MGLDSGVGDSDKVDSEAAPADTNSYQVLDILNKYKETPHIIYLHSQNLSSKFAHRVYNSLWSTERGFTVNLTCGSWRSRERARGE